MDHAAWYRYFAEREARGTSPTYERLAAFVAESASLIEWLGRLPGPKRQPNLLFAAVRSLDGPVDEPHRFTEFVDDHGDAIAERMLARSTQTNEAARCAATVVALRDVIGPVALIEVGASAGLCLVPDLYSYDFEGVTVGDAELRIAVDTPGGPVGKVGIPEVVWRVGLDQNPLDPSDADDLDWLRACVWPEHRERRERLDAAAAIAARKGLDIRRGDLLTDTLDLIDEAPDDAVKVVMHSAVLAYVDEAGRSGFAESLRSLVDDRSDVIWLSNEAPGVLPGLPDVDESRRSHFVVARDGRHVIATADPHGSWIRLR